MKKFLMTASLLALFAAPAWAQSGDPSLGTGNIVPGPHDIYVWPWPGHLNARPLPAYVLDELAWPAPHAYFAPCCAIPRYPAPYGGPR